MQGKTNKLQYFFFFLIQLYRKYYHCQFLKQINIFYFCNVLLIFFPGNSSGNPMKTLKICIVVINIKRGVRINRVMGRDLVKHEQYQDILDNDIKCRKHKSKFMSSDNEQG